MSDPSRSRLLRRGLRAVAATHAAVLLASAATTAHAEVHTVTNTNASGSGSFAAAIAAANASQDLDQIDFAISGDGVHVIAGNLPPITGPVSINGYTQPGSAPGTTFGTIDAVVRIQLDGTGVIDHVLEIQSPTVTVRGLAISNIQVGASGIYVAAGMTNVGIYGNFIGTDASGLEDASDGTGISSDGTVTIGGTPTADRNLISGNSEAGIALYGPDSQVVNNLIGLNRLGGGAGNGDGIVVAGFDAGATVIGGLGANTFNIIGENAGIGVWVMSGVEGTTRINGNRFHGNDGLAIDLHGDGPTGNDVDDTDSGANGLQNYYEVTFARRDGDTLHVEGRLNSTPGEYLVEIFRSSGPDESGFGEGAVPISALEVVIPPGQNAVFDRRQFTLPPGLPAQYITAIATNEETGETSEFSPAVVTVEGGDELVVTNTLNTGAGSLRAAVTAANAASDINTIVFDIPGSGVKTIPLLTGLSLSQPVIVDGYSQEGAKTSYLDEGSNAEPMIVLDGIGAGESPGLVLFAGQTIVRGLVIQRFGTNGITLADGSIGARVEGNFIGTDHTGLVDRGNGRNAVNVFPLASNATIGGAFAHQGNVLSGNGESGIATAGTALTIQSNVIGGSAAGTALGNDERGIVVFGSFVTVGGARGGNRIQSNGQAGVRVLGGSEVDVQGNSIFDNGGLGIELGAQGVTPNDPDDEDEGDNLLQNFPVLTEVVSSRGLSVEGTLDVGQAGEFRIDLYANATCDVTGHGEGAEFLGSATVELDPLEEDFKVLLNVDVVEGAVFTATATDLDGNTSEFSECFEPGNDYCGDPNFSNSILTGDALIALNTAVGLRSCDACLCDVNDSGTITTNDAQLILRFSVGHPVVLACPACD